jgi:hypothetical protein
MGDRNIKKTHCTPQPAMCPHIHQNRLIKTSINISFIFLSSIFLSSNRNDGAARSTAADQSSAYRERALTRSAHIAPGLGASSSGGHMTFHPRGQSALGNFMLGDTALAYGELRAAGGGGTGGSRTFSFGRRCLGRFCRKGRLLGACGWFFDGALSPLLAGLDGLDLFCRASNRFSTSRNRSRFTGSG